MRGAISLVGIPNTVTGNKTFSGVITVDNQLVVNGASGAVVTLKLAANASQTGNLLEFYNTAGTRVAYFDQAGNFTSTGAVSYSSTQVAQGGGVGFSVKRASTNVGDILQWQDQSGVSMGSVSWNGMISTSCSVSPALKITGDSFINGIFQVAGNNTSSNLTKNAYIQGLQYPGISYQGVLFGYDVYFNGTNYIIPGDGANNEAGGMQIDSGGIVHFFNRSSTGGASVTLSEAQFEAIRTAYIDAAGNLGIRGMQFRSDGLTSDPGVPWLSTNGLSLFIDPTGLGSNVFIGWNNPSNGFLVKGCVKLNYGSNTETTAGTSDVRVYVNTASAGALGGRVTFTSDGPTGSTGARLEYKPPTAGNTANVLTISGDGGTALTNLDLLATGVNIGSLQVATSLTVYGDVLLSPGATYTGSAYKLSAASNDWAIKLTGTHGAEITSTITGSTRGIGGTSEESIILFYDDGNSEYVSFTNSSGAPVLTFRNDNSTSAPITGEAWMRGDTSGNFALNPGGSGQLFFAWDTANQTNFGGAVHIVGTLNVGTISSTGALSISGALTVGGALTLNNQAIFRSGASFNNATFWEVTIDGVGYKIPLYT